MESGEDGKNATARLFRGLAICLAVGTASISAMRPAHAGVDYATFAFAVIGYSYVPAGQAYNICDPVNCQPFYVQGASARTVTDTALA